ncbi:MAG: TlyA family RNA methyltransferase [Candidatus Babeliaceae bacterium]|nr:TlyA family RNA methyltransferase [Candidatus Babeliaceae bacterium]
MRQKKKRLDVRVLELYPHLSRKQIQSFIIEGRVFVDGHPCTKAGTPVDESNEISVRAETPRFVCRAGFKIEKALEHFGVDVTGLTILDAGLSTGGFTDCLLQKGARKVYGIDVGYGQVHEKIRSDPRVVVLERTNLRHYEHTGDPIDIVTLDLSFISIIKVLPAIKKILPIGGKLITLIKPQFEAEKGEVPRGGVIRNEVQREQIVQSVVKNIELEGFSCQGVIPSPIEGTAGNIEFLALFIRK